MNSLPLAGRRIVVTRAAAQASEVVDQLRQLGAEPILVALIEIVEPTDGGADLRSATADLADYDWIVVASPNAARRIRSAVQAVAAARDRPLIAAVGRSTGDVLGGVVDLVPSRQLAAGLVEEFPCGSGTVLVVQPETGGVRPADTGRAAQGGEAQGAETLSKEARSGKVRAGDSTLVAGLRRKGWSVRAVAAYRTVAVVPQDSQRERVLAADAVVFASGSAVKSWFAAFGTMTPEVTVAIGPSTAQEMSNFGLKISSVATDYSVQGLVTALLAQFPSTK